MDELKFYEKEHKYFKNNIEYKSVSKVIELVKPHFPTNIIAGNVAKSQGVSKEEILSEWKTTRELASQIGNDIHNALDEYSKNGVSKDLYWNNVAKDIENKLFKKFNTIDSEIKVHSDKYKVAGTIDRCCYRNKNVIDIRDFKTNEKNGIVYEDKYKKYLKEPLSHLESSNYNTYSLQLSIYGLLIEEMLNYKIGNLALIYIPPLDPMNWSYIPVPYMKKEAEALLAFKLINDLN
tara:strand:+ start:1869 stop:2573 length:705 start_codon:yes stop_codon:yes gene_type:complete